MSVLWELAERYTHSSVTDLSLSDAAQKQLVSSYFVRMLRRLSVALQSAVARQVHRTARTLVSTAARRQPTFRSTIASRSPLHASLAQVHEDLAAAPVPA